MSEPLDARVLRRMVRETAAETHAEIDWDSAEERLLARLDAPPSELAKALLESESSGRDEAGEDEPSVLEMGDSGSFQAPDVLIHVPGLSKLAIVDDAAPSAVGAEELSEGSSATDSDHSPSLLHEPPKRRAAATRPTKHTRWGAIAGALAVAACVAFFLAGGAHLFGRTNGSAPTDSTISAERWVDPADVAMAPGLDNVRDLGALRAGDVVEATQGAVTFGAKDRLTWTLSPGSRVLVRSGLDDGSSMRHVLVLENGSIRADVIKPSGTSGEPFVVEAGDTDVDTDAWDPAPSSAGSPDGLPDTGHAIFSVTRSSIGIVVDVEVGATTVGSRIDGTKKRMSAPARAAVSLDGARDFKLLDPIKTAMREPPRPDPIAPLPAPSPEIIHPQPPSVPEPARPAPQAPDAQTAAPAEPPAAPRPADAALTESAISSMLNSCFADVQAKRKANDQDSGVAVSMHSTLSLVVDSESSIHAAAFNPPLRPDLQSCAVGLLHKKVTGGARTISLPIDISR